MKDPRAVFNRLFGKPDSRVQSVLDVILEDARRLDRTLGSNDRAKLAEFFDSVRAVEQQIARAEQRQQPDADLQKPAAPGLPKDRGKYIRLMMDLIAIAFEQDLTRVATLVIDPERWDTPRMYHGVFDSPQNHHVLTHTKGDEAKEKLQKIDHFHVEQLAHLIGRLDDRSEQGSRLLDHCLVTYGSGMGNGTIHDYNDLPILTAGNLSGAFSTGVHYRLDRKVPVANLWLTMAQQAGLDLDHFADSTRNLSEVLA